jgi:hypothetical protein
VPPVVLLSYSLKQGRFGSDSSIVDRHHLGWTALHRDQRHARGFAFPQRLDVCASRPLSARGLAESRQPSWSLWRARLKPGVTGTSSS